MKHNVTDKAMYIDSMLPKIWGPKKILGLKKMVGLKKTMRHSWIFMGFLFLLLFFFHGSLLL